MSEILIAKSESSLLAANHLQNESVYHSTVHCAYYSCVQLSKYILLNVLNRELEVKQNKNRFHAFYIQEIFTTLKNRQEIIKAIDFQNKIIALKKLREQADYEAINIAKSKSEEAIRKSKEVQEILYKIFLS